MGVEYQHYLIPDDPTLEIDESEINLIVNVLDRHGIWKSEANPFYIDNEGHESSIKTSEGWISHDGINGLAVEKLFGESRYENIAPKERYLQGVTIIYGKSKKLHYGGEEIEVLASGLEIIDVDVPFSQPFFEMTFSEIDESNIEIYINNPEISDISWFKGWWKSAIQIDFGKDLPKWSESAKNPNGTLLNDLEKAAGIKFREIGNHY